MDKNGPIRTSSKFRFFAVGATLASVIGSQTYYAITLTPYNHTSSTVIFGVFLPLLIGCVLLAITGQHVLLFGFVSLFLSVVDDIPVLFDWPRLTGIPPGVSHDAMQVYIYELSAVFLLASFCVIIWRNRPGWRRALISFALIMGVFLLSFADDLPSSAIATYADQAWYQLYALEHLASLAAFYFAILVSSGSKYRRSRGRTLDAPDS